MREPGAVPADLVAAIRRVVGDAVQRVDGLRSDRVMVVGAWCRDIWHHALGHQFRTAATQDLDLAIAVDSWAVFDAIAKDASDIALAMHWYAESPETHDRLYDTEVGRAALLSEELDVCALPHICSASTSGQRSDRSGWPSFSSDGPGRVTLGCRWGDPGAASVDDHRSRAPRDTDHRTCHAATGTPAV